MRKIITLGIGILLAGSLPVAKAYHPNTPYLLTSASLATDGTAILSDGAEHGYCPAGDRKVTSLPSLGHLIATCARNDGDGVQVSTHAARSGTYGYELVVSAGSAATHSTRESIGVAKMAASTHVTDNQPAGATLRYEAWFYIASGFHDNAWHIQMQWKGQDNNRQGIDRFWHGQNPKVAWGFMQRKSQVRQVEVVIRDAYRDRCDSVSYDRFTRSSTLDESPIPVPDGTWIRIVTELHFHERDGYIRVWQGDTERLAMVVDASGIDTMSQVIQPSLAKTTDTPCNKIASTEVYRTAPTHFSFGLANYLSGQSFSTLQEPHTLYIDDIRITRLQ